MRVLVAWCPDWSVTAGLFELAETGEARPATDQPAAVLSNNVVEVCNAAARTEGVRLSLIHI